MSVAELKHAATAPHRWIALSSSKDRNEDGVLPSRRFRLLNLDPYYHELYLVPGGRYLVACRSRDYYVAIWDLGYVSDGNLFLQPTQIWGTTSNRMQTLRVHPTPDGLGIRILTYSSGLTPLMPGDNPLRVFEIYPQKVIEDAKVAELNLNFLEDLNPNFFLYGNRVVVYDCSMGIVIVWDFIANTTASWSVRIPHEAHRNMIFRATETTIMILYTRNANHLMWIFQIPPLVTKTPLFDTEEDPPEVTPILTFEYSDASAAAGFPISDCWYSGDLSSLPFYFDVERSQNGNVGRYKVNITSDLTNLSLTPTAADPPIPVTTSLHFHEAYRICENNSVNVHHSGGLNAITWGFDPFFDYHGSSQTPTPHLNTTPLVTGRRNSSFCPASARLVYQNNAGDFFIRDFL